MRVLVFIIWFSLFSLNLLSCGAIKPRVKKDSGKDPRTLAEESFDPWSLDEVEPTVTESLFVKESKRQTADFFGDVAPRDSQQKFEMLYRVQVFATKFPQQASQIADSLRAEFEERVHVDYESPYYKVRLGDFEKEQEAKKFLRMVRSKGYFESWIIKVKARVENVKD